MYILIYFQFIILRRHLRPEVLPYLENLNQDLEMGLETSNGKVRRYQVRIG